MHSLLWCDAVVVWSVWYKWWCDACENAMHVRVWYMWWCGHVVFWFAWHVGCACMWCINLHSCINLAKASSSFSTFFLSQHNHPRNALRLTVLKLAKKFWTLLVEQLSLHKANNIVPQLTSSLLQCPSAYHWSPPLYLYISVPQHSANFHTVLKEALLAWGH